MADPALIRTMADRIQAMPEFKGCSIGYQGRYGMGGLMSLVVTKGDPNSANNKRVIVVIEEIEIEDPSVNYNTTLWAQSDGSPPGSPNPMIVENRSRLTPELAGAGLTCGLAVVSAVGVLGGAAAEVPSGGASTFLVIVAWTGMVTQGVECVNSLTRLSLIAYDPGGSELQTLDDNSIYKYTMLTVDAINLASGLAGLPAGMKNLFAVLARQRTFLARGLTFAVLKNMNRMERMKVIGELFAEATRSKEGLNELMTAVRAAGVGPNSIARAEMSLSVRNAEKVAGAISEITVKRLRSALLSIFSVPAGAAASSLPSALVGGAASGSVNYVINLIAP